VTLKPRMGHAGRANSLEPTTRGYSPVEDATWFAWCGRSEWLWGPSAGGPSVAIAVSTRWQVRADIASACPGSWKTIDDQALATLR